MRKVLSFVLVLSLVLGSFGFAFAGDPDTKIQDVPADVEGTRYETAVQVLMALDVVTGYPDGSYKPAGDVTRAEMATLIVKVLGLADSADYMGSSSFSDMSGHWADKYVAVIAGKDIVNGYPDGTFKPNAKVSFAETTTMIVRALGYVDGCEDLVGNWPVNYVSLAEDLDITDGVDVAFAEASDRGSVATMIYNSLDVGNVTVNSDMEVKEKKDSKDNEISFLNKLDCYLDEDEVIQENWVGDEDYTLIDINDYVYADVDVYRLDDDDDFDGSKNAYEDKDPIIAIDEVNSDIVTAEFDADIFTKDKEIEDADGNDYNIKYLFDHPTTTPAFLNGGERMFDDIKQYLDGYDITIYGEFKDNDDDYFETITGIVAWAPTGEMLVEDDDIDDIADAIEDGNGEIFKVELPTVDDDGDELDLNNIIVKGAADKLEDIEENDIVTIYASADQENDDEYDKVRIDVAREVKEIKVKKKNGDKKVYDTDGNEYKIAKLELDVTGFDFDGEEDDDNKDYNIGDVYEVRLDSFGYIYTSDEVKTTPDLYGIVVAAEDKSGTEDAKLRLFTSEGKTNTFDVDVDDEDADTLMVDGAWTATATGIFGTVGSGEYSDPDEVLVVSYELDKSGNIDELKIVVNGKDTNVDKGLNKEYSAKSEKWNSEGFDSGAVIFDISDDTAAAVASWDFTSDPDDGDWDVVSELKDDDEYSALYGTNDDGDIEAMVIFVSTSDNQYFAVNDVYEVEDDEYQVVGFVDGEAATKISDGHDLTDDSNTAFVYVVDYSAGDIHDATEVRSGTALGTKGYQKNKDIGATARHGYEAGVVTDTGKNGFDVDDTFTFDSDKEEVENANTDDAKFVEFADDAVVYRQVFEDHEPDLIKVGDDGDVSEGDYIICTYDEDGDIDMVVIVDEDDVYDYHDYLNLKGL